MKHFIHISLRKSGTLFSLFLVFIMLSLSACSSQSASSSSESKEAIKVGALLTLSGPFASAGEGIKEGLELFLDENNHTLAGRKVEAIYEDDESNAQVSIRKLRKLIENDKSDIILGAVTSTVAYAVRDQVDQSKVPFIVVNAGANGLAWEKKSEYMYKTSSSNWQLGVAPAAYIAKNIGKKVYVVAQDYPAGREQAEAFKTAFEAAGGTIVEMAYTKLGASDYATFLTQIAQAKPDVVYNTAPGADGVRFTLQYSDFGLKGKIPYVSQIADEIITTPEIIKAIDGEYYFTPYANQIDNETNKKFIASFKKKYNRDPENYMMLGYTAGQALYKAIEKAGNTKSEDIIKALKELKIDTPVGPLNIDPATHIPVVDMYMMKYVAKDGKMTYTMLDKLPGIPMPATEPKK